MSVAFLPTVVFAQEAVQNINTPALPLAKALNALSAQTGLQIAFSNADVAGISVPAISGGSSPKATLDQMLAGTGLSAFFVNARMVSITTSAQTDAGLPIDNGSLLLDAITITGGGQEFTANTNYETASSVAFYSEKDIQSHRGMSTGDFLKGNPGVLNGENRNSGALDVNVRGMQGRGRVPVVIDGSFQETTVYRGYSGVAGRTYLDPDLIGSMSIEKGPSAGADAAGATGGIVRVSTLKPNDIIPEGADRGVRLKFGAISNTTDVPAVSTAGGTDERFERSSLFDFNGVSNGSLAFAQRFGKFELLGAYARRTTGNYYAGQKGTEPNSSDLNAYGLGEEILNTSQENTSYLVRGVYSWGDNHSIDASFIRYESAFGEMMPSQIIRFAGPVQSVLSNVDVDTLTVRYNWSPEDNNLINLKADFFATDNNTYINTAYDFGFMAVGQAVSSRSRQWGLNLSNTSDFEFGDQSLSLNYGLSFKKELMGLPDDPDKYFGDLVYNELTVDYRDGWRQEYSAFVAASYKPNNKLTINGSLRYIDMESQDNRAIDVWVDDGNGGLTKEQIYKHQEINGLAPIVSVMYEIKPGLQLYGKYAGAHRTPSLFESTVGWSASPDPYNILEPEHAKNKEIGINFQKASAFTDGDFLQVKLAYFDNHIDNYITRDTSAGWNFVNIDSAEFRGWEMSLRYDQGKYFGEMSVSHYIDTEFCSMTGVCSSGGTKGGYVQAHVPPETSATLTLGGRFYDDKLELGTRITYIGDRASIDFSSLTGGAVTAVDWDPYTTIDLFGSYDINDKITLDFAVDNVMDQYYMDSLSLGLNPAPGRTIRVGLTATF